MTTDDARRDPSHLVRIVDPPGLQELMQEVYQDAGSLRRAAARLGVGRDTFRRLLKGETREYISKETFAALMEAFQGIAFPYGTHARLRQTVATADFGIYQHAYQGWLEGEYQRLKGVAHETFQQLFDQAVFKRFFQDHLEKLGMPRSISKEESLRLWLSIYRAVEPLTHHSATWGVERSWEQLQASHDLRGFLRAALRIERILLAREGDTERMRNCPPPDEFLASLADADAPDSAKEREALLRLLEEGDDESRDGV